MSKEEEQNLKSLKQSSSSFHNGCYVQCKSIAKQIVNKDQTTPVVEWVAENNILASDFQLTKMQENNVDSAAFHSKFQRLLQKVQSLPVSRQGAELEMRVLYNCIQSDDEQRSHRWVSLVTALLSRIRAHLEGTQRTLGISDSLSQLPYGSLSKKALCSTCVVLAVGLVKSGYLETAKLFLTPLTIPQLSTRFTQNISLSTETPAEFAVRVGQGSPPLTEEDTDSLVHILLASCHLAEDNPDQSRALIQKVKVARFKTVAVYIRALSLYKEQRNAEAVAVLQELTSDDINSTEDSLRARLHCLTGCCVARLGKPRTAVHHFKAALEADFSYAVPLYYIAEQYKQLHLETAELESLNLLTMALENSPSTKERKSQTLDRLVLSEVLRLLDKPCRLSVIQVQYRLAVRCLHLHRYEAAYQRYMDLIAHLVKADVIQCEGQLIKLPRLHQVFLEAIQSSLRCKKLAECVTLCDQALQCGPVDTLNDSPLLLKTKGGTPSTEVKGGKRKRKSTDEELDGEELSSHYRVEYQLQKSEALEAQGELEEAAVTLHSVAEELETRLSRMTNQRQEVTDEQPMKRAKISPDSEEATSPDSPQQCLSQVYVRLGKVSSQQAKHTKAIHYYRLSLQLNQDNKTTVYHLTKELFGEQRLQEAVYGWLESQKISPRMDTFQINREIQIRETKLKGLKKGPSTECPDEADVVGMDVQVLKVLLNHKQNHVWRVT